MDSKVRVGQGKEKMRFLHNLKTFGKLPFLVKSVIDGESKQCRTPRMWEDTEILPQWEGLCLYEVDHHPTVSRKEHETDGGKCRGGVSI